MTVEVGDVLRVVLRQTSAYGTDIENVYQFQAAGSGNSGDSTVMAALASWADVTYANINAQIPTAQSPIDMKVDQIELSGGQVVIVRNLGTTSWGSTYNPSGAGEGYALGVAILILLRTQWGKIFGRKYIGQVSETTISGNALATGTPLTNFTSFLSALTTDPTADGLNFNMGILSTRNLVWNDFLEAVITTEVGYQRRRAIRKGS